MSVWRTKAYEMFGFRPGSYSHARGKVDLFADLLEMAKKATRDDDELLGRIGQYVAWADAQPSDELASAVDLAFFLPLLRGERAFLDRLESVLSPELIATKQRLLVDQPRS
jgi:hypothetical protein